MHTGVDSSSKFSGIAASGRFFFRAEASMGEPFLATEASVRGEAALRGTVAEAPQGSLAQGGGEGHQTVSGGSAHVVGSFFGGPGSQ